MGVRQPVFFKQGINYRFLFGAHLANNQILIGGEPEVAIMHFGNFTKSGHHRIIFGIEDAPVLDKQRVMPGVISDPQPIRSGRRSAQR